MSLETRIITMKTALVAGIATIALTLGLVISPFAGAAGISVGGPSDCDSNAMIRCGAHSTGALMDAYQNSAYVRRVYSSMGISHADMAEISATNVAGKVTKSGNVFVDGQSSPVATGATTEGREDMPGSTRSVTGTGEVYFKRPPSVSFQSDSLPAFVSMKNGKFQFAILASCGNAVVATPAVRAAAAPKPTPAPAPVAPAPAAPAPTPAPTQTQSQSQSQSQSVVVEQAATPAPAPAPKPAPAPAPTPAPAPQALPNTGPAGIAGVFAAAASAGTLIYRRFLTRRFS